MRAKHRLAELKKQMETMRQEMKDTAKAAFKEMSADLFTSHPALVSFSWSQYTPYFCDGDPCHFSANTYEPKTVFTVDGDEVEMEGYDVPAAREWDGKKYVTKKLEGVEADQRKAYEAVREFLGIFDNDDFKQLFGDHVRVTVKATGVDTDEYDHE